MASRIASPRSQLEEYPTASLGSWDSSSASTCRAETAPSGTGTATTSTSSRPPAWCTTTLSRVVPTRKAATVSYSVRSEEHTSELQSRGHLVCRLLLEKKKKHGKSRT